MSPFLSFSRLDLLLFHRQGADRQTLVMMMGKEQLILSQDASEGDENGDGEFEEGIKFKTYHEEWIANPSRIGDPRKTCEASRVRRSLQDKCQAFRWKKCFNVKHLQGISLEIDKRTTMRNAI